MVLHNDCRVVARRRRHNVRQANGVAGPFLMNHAPQRAANQSAGEQRVRAGGARVVLLLLLGLVVLVLVVVIVIVVVWAVVVVAVVARVVGLRGAGRTLASRQLHTRSAECHNTGLSFAQLTFLFFFSARRARSARESSSPARAPS